MIELLRVEGLKTWFRTGSGTSKAVDGVSFRVAPGRTVALVGESGCGKSVTALSLARLLAAPPARFAGGRILYRGEDVLTMTPGRLASLRGSEIAYIFQEPSMALNPVVRVGRQIGEAVALHRHGVRVADETLSLLRQVGFPDPERNSRAYPHQLSGGMQQRAMIAMALACRPSLLVADEPTTALDVTIQDQILELLASVQRRYDMAVLLITHNLGLVSDRADSLHIMYAGRIVESGPAARVLQRPAHPYTRALLAAVPRLDGTAGRLPGIPGAVPDPRALPSGCKFNPRCVLADDRCRRDEPPADPVDGEADHTARCWRAERSAFPAKKPVSRVVALL